MATLSGSYVYDSSTLANFKSWAQAISAAFAAFGWVQTADTGQVNWATIPAVPSSAFVYEVWRANDALAATMPIYVKLEYGFATNNTAYRITVGTGSNGAGTITGGMTSPFQPVGLNSNAGATTYPCYFSGSAGEIRVSMWSNTSLSPNTPSFFGIERSKDGNGINTASYVTVIAGFSNSNGGALQQSFSTTQVGLRRTGIMAIGLDGGGNTGSEFGGVAAFPIFPTVGQLGNPILGFMTAYQNDVGSAGATVTVSSLYGGTHTYVPIPGCSLAFASRSVGGATISGLMRYE